MIMFKTKHFIHLDFASNYLLLLLIFLDIFMIFTM